MALQAQVAGGPMVSHTGTRQTQASTPASSHANNGFMIIEKTGASAAVIASAFFLVLQ
jgi:hypothetical protein